MQLRRSPLRVPIIDAAVPRLGDEIAEMVEVVGGAASTVADVSDNAVEVSLY